MRCVSGVLIAVLILVAPADAAPRAGEPASAEAVQKWISGYREKPDLAHVPAAVQALSRLGALKDPESSGIYIGFMAGIIGTNPSRAEELIVKMLPLRPGDDWAIVRAIAYSSLPDWKGVMTRVAPRLPSRRVMIDAYLSGKLPALDDIPLEDSPPFMDKVKGYLSFSSKKAPRKVTLDSSPEFLDTFWGYYFATGAYRPVVRMVSVLPWSKERSTVDRLTVGSMAKYTLASNAARDSNLLAILKSVRRNQPKEVEPILAEVIEAAETVDTTRLRKEALAAIEELKRKGPDSKRQVAFWGMVGEGALALGCIAAAVTGQVELGLPCVIGGAATSGALRMWND